MKHQIQIFTIISIVSIVSFVSVAYSDTWNLKQLSKANPNGKAWLVQILGDSVLVRNKTKKQVLQKDPNTPYPIEEGDLLVTGMDDQATVLLRDGSVIWVNYMTIFKFSKMSVPSLVPGQSTEDYEVNLKLKVGGVRVRVPKIRTIQKKFTVETPQGLAAVRGTEEVVQYSPELGTRIQVLSGLVSLENQDNRVEYASRGQNLAIQPDTEGAENVNQKQRSEVRKNIQIATGSQESQTVLLPEIEQLAIVPSQASVTTDSNHLVLNRITELPGYNNYSTLKSLITKALQNKSIANQIIQALKSHPALGLETPKQWLLPDIDDAVLHLY